MRHWFEHNGEREFDSQSAAIKSIAPKIGCGPDTLRAWVRRAETDSGRRDGVTTAERDRIKALERENRQLRQANEILKKASAYFAPALIAASGDCRAVGRSSTARFGNDPLYQRTSRCLRGRADLSRFADRSMVRGNCGMPCDEKVLVWYAARSNGSCATLGSKVSGAARRSKRLGRTTPYPAQWIV